LKNQIKILLKENRTITILYKKILSFISNSLFKLLIKLDASFLSNISTHTKSINQSNNIKSLIISRNEVILIMNEDGLIINREMFEAYLNSIFSNIMMDKNNNLISFKEKLTNYFIDNNLFLANQNDILKEIKKYISIHFKKINNELGALYFDLLSAISLFERDLITNINSYSTIGKLNPDAVFWPDPSDKKRNRSLFTDNLIVQKYEIITPQTPIGSAGSCFAMEIAHELLINNYNYIVEEKDINSASLPESCAMWGIIFNTPSFKQLIERSFCTRKFPKIISSGKINEKIVYTDPFRMGINFNSVDEYEENLRLHIEAARIALLKVEVFVITLGVNEVWYFKSDGSVFSFSPWRVAPGLIGHKVLTVEENITDLQKMLDIWRAYNNKLKLIVTVSPVPLHATFRGDEQHVIVANMHSKAVLRVAAEEFVKRNKDVYYFPSYEVVTSCTKNPWDIDQRHVSREAVENVMLLFQKMYVTKN
jgi:GSCFA family